MKFTKKEISLCRQVAGKHRKPIEQGDWYFDNPIAEPLLWSAHNKVDLMPGSQKKLNVFPLWTISDCLEFLRKNNYDVTLYYFAYYGYWTITIRKKSSEKAFYSNYGNENNNKTPLETCLKAVLAVLEEGK